MRQFLHRKLQSNTDHRKENIMQAAPSTPQPVKKTRCFKPAHNSNNISNNSNSSAALDGNETKKTITLPQKWQNLRQLVSAQMRKSAPVHISASYCAQLGLESRQGGSVVGMPECSRPRPAAAAAAHHAWRREREEKRRQGGHA